MTETNFKINDRSNIVKDERNSDDVI